VANYARVYELRPSEYHMLNFIAIDLQLQLYKIFKIMRVSFLAHSVELSGEKARVLVMFFVTLTWTSVASASLTDVAIMQLFTCAKVTDATPSLVILRVD